MNNNLPTQTGKVFSGVLNGFPLRRKNFSSRS